LTNPPEMPGICQSRASFRDDLRSTECKTTLQVIFDPVSRIKQNIIFHL
jgi:hypothetical protein